MAGANLEPAALGGSSLVIIDAQREYVDGKLPLTGVDPAMEKIATLLARARAAGTTIIHILHKGKTGGAFDPDGPGYKPAPHATPVDGETIIDKGLPNAFAGTELDAALKQAGSKPLILAGFMTHMCVSSTARAALDLGYSTTVVADAVATRDLPNPSGGVITADTLNASSLAALSDRFAVVVPLDRFPD
jgi:nicotinamidase-related amidase